jgi:2-methylisocitrate lyase-like PEP mutase family enzyme
MSAEQAAKADRFLELHRGDTPLLLPNPWDAGSAKILATIGFQALATTSAGMAATFGRLDGNVTRDEALAHARVIVDATDLPVSADLENCFEHTPEGVAETVRLAIDTGLAGGSCEDWGNDNPRIYDASLATERVAAAAEAAHAGPVHYVLTARCENYLRGIQDLDDTIARLVAYRDAGADVVYAPGLTDLGQIAAVVEAVGIPVNVLGLPTGPTMSELESVGVRRVSVGSLLASAAYAALVAGGRELLDEGTSTYARSRIPEELRGQAFGAA